MKILAIKWRRLGDTVLWTSALQALQQHFPGAEVDLALPAEYDALFAADPNYKTRYLLKSDRAHLRKLVAAWQNAKYDLVLGFHANPTTRALATSANAKTKILHHHSRNAHVFGSDLPVVHLGQVASATERDLNVVRTLGWDGVSPATHLICPPHAKNRALENYRLKAGTEPRKLIVLSPGASRLSKRWPLERYVELVKSFPTDQSIAVIAANESEFLGRSEVLKALQSRASIFFTPQLEDAMGLLSLAQVYVGSDSGLKHVAAALGVPTVTLFGPESVGEWHPYSPDRHTALQVKVGCRTNDASDPHFAWCGVEVCPLASHACLTLTFPDRVRAAIERYL